MAALGAGVTLVESDAACHLVHFCGATAAARIDRERPERGRAPRCRRLATALGKLHCPIAVDYLDRCMEQQACVPLVIRYDGEEPTGA